MDLDKENQFLADYENYVKSVLIPTSKELIQIFEAWRQPSYWALEAKLARLPSPSPVQRTLTRIKRPESVLDKITRHPSIYPDGFAIGSVRKMNDAVGGRIIVYFLSNLPLIDRELRTSECLEISSEQPPIAYLSHDLMERLGFSHIKRGKKESGYASIHYLARLRRSEVPPSDRPWFELQVRTLAEDLWGEVEHILGYKPGKKTSFAVRKQFQIISAELTAIDEHFNLLYEELARFQKESIYRDESPLNAENLPAVLSEAGIGCAQKEIDGLLKLLWSRGLESVEDLRVEATAERIDMIRNAYRGYEKRVPNNFEVVAALAAISGMKDQKELEHAIKSQIAFLKAWEKLKTMK